MSGMTNDSPLAARGNPVRGVIEAALMIAVATLIGLALAPRWGTAAIDMLYLPPVLVAAIWSGRRTAMAAAMAAALAYNYFFTAPRLTFRIDSPNELLTVLVLLVVALAASHLAASVRAQAALARGHAGRNAAIAGFARRLLGCSGRDEIAGVAVSELGRLFACNAVLAIPGTAGGDTAPIVIAAAPATIRLNPNDVSVAALVLESGDCAGRGVDRALPTEWQFHPVRSNATTIAVMGLARDDGSPAVRRDQLSLLDSLLDQLALAFERDRLEQEASAHVRDRERDRVRETLLSTIGDDLHPPLRTMREAVDDLRRSHPADNARLSALGGELARLQRYVDNLMELSPVDAQPPIAVGDGVTIDLFQRQVQRHGEEVHLAPREYAVLAELARHPGRVLSHAHLLRTAWGPAQEGQVDYLRVAIRGLRQKLEVDPAHPRLIVNEPAVGYRLASG
jgi:two-component system sensor histidine kinase KdpD